MNTGADAPLAASGVDRPVADATGNWVDRYAPRWVRPYMRLARADRPIGSWLLLIPCLWSTALAATMAGDRWPSVGLIALFALGAIAMRGAGCTWNDFLDRDIDGKVERTRSRPIPSGQVSPRRALVFLVAQALVGLVVLLMLPRFAILTGIASLGVVAIYPLMKRVMDIPQLVLGLAFSWGALMGFAAVLEHLPASAFLLYAGTIAWVIGYDTIYAHQDREDDAMIGLGSSALLFGRQTRPWMIGLYVLTVALIGAALFAAGAGIAAYAGLAVFALHLGRQVYRLDIDNPALCLSIFKSNRDAGLLLFAGLAVDTVLRGMSLSPAL